MAHLTHQQLWFEHSPAHCTTTQRHWLTRPGALTQGLRQLGTFSLRLVSEGIERTPSEDLNIMGHTLLWRREVLMSIDERPCVIARSITPLRASHGYWQGIRKLGRRPLADILYQDPGIRRGLFEFARIGRVHQLHRSLLRANLTEELHNTLLARRSVFWRQQQPLMVSECFLESFWYITSAQQDDLPIRDRH